MRSAKVRPILDSIMGLVELPAGPWASC
jgi:hypothetical protein